MHFRVTGGQKFWPLKKLLIQAFSICRFGDHYEWNKVTTCVHNILSGQRWIEHYGEVTIRNMKSSACLCKLTFVKVRKTSLQRSPPVDLIFCSSVFVYFLASRETTGVQMWMRFKGLWWIKKVKWSTGCLGSGTKVFTAASHLLPNACGGQVGIHNCTYTHRCKEVLNSVAIFCRFQAPCPQTMSSTTASPGLPLSWTNFAPSWKMCCPAQTPGSDPIKGTASAALSTVHNGCFC